MEVCVRVQTINTHTRTHMPGGPSWPSRQPGVGHHLGLPHPPVCARGARDCRVNTCKQSSSRCTGVRVFAPSWGRPSTLQTRLTFTRTTPWMLCLVLLWKSEHAAH